MIAPALRGCDLADQRSVDQVLVDLDGTADRGRLGANALLAASVACAKAGAIARCTTLWRHLADLHDAEPAVPLPMVNILSGNLHAVGGMDIQDLLIVPHQAPDYLTALHWVAAVYRRVGAILAGRGLPALVGDEGGYGFGGSSEAAFALVVEAIEAEGLRPGIDVSLALDVAATHLVDGDRYRVDGDLLTGGEFLVRLLDWSRRYPICSIEDPFDEDAWDLWADFTGRSASNGFQVLGDDLITTHRDRLDRAITSRAANAVLVKANQIGTLTEAVDVARHAAGNDFRAVVSARSGETEDDWLADLAVATGAGQIKVGSIVRSERLAKYNRLLRICDHAPKLRYAGGSGHLPFPTENPSGDQTTS